jgi:hypothetical protein
MFFVSRKDAKARREGRNSTLSIVLRFKKWLELEIEFDKLQKLFFKDLILMLG